MDDFTSAAELAQVTQKSPVLVIIEQHVLARELTGFEIVEMATTSGLSWFSGRDIRLIALNIGIRKSLTLRSRSVWRFSRNSVRKHPLHCCQIVTTK